VLSFNSETYIVMPHWLLHGIIRFSCHQEIPLPALLDALREMPMLEYFELQRCSLPWKDTDASPSPPIQMPSLMYFSVYANSLRFFTLLNQRLALPEGAKRRLELKYQVASDLNNWETWLPLSLKGVRAANKLTHIRFSGGAMEGTIRIWAGDHQTTDHEDAEFSFTMNWTGYVRLRQSHGGYHPPIVHLALLCDLLGATTARTLILEPHQKYSGNYKEQSRSALWAFLGALTSVEELELDVDGADVLLEAWRDKGAPAVLPALRRVRMGRVDSAAHGVVAVTEEGLLRLLQGSDKQYPGSSRA
jgi:hypothetical protein